MPSSEVSLHPRDGTLIASYDNCIRVCKMKKEMKDRRKGGGKKKERIN